MPDAAKVQKKGRENTRGSLVVFIFIFFFNFLSPGIGLPLYKLLDGMTQLLLASVLLLSMLFQPIRMCINYWCVETLR